VRATTAVTAVVLAAGAAALGAAALVLGSEQPVRWPEPAPDAGVPAGTDDPGALAALDRAATASQGWWWSGTQVVMAWTPTGGASAVLDVEHVPGQGLTVGEAGEERTGALALLGTGSGTRGSRPATEDVRRHHALALVGREQVAGRSTTVVEARGASGTTTLWVDDESGLVLRREVRDTAGEVVGSSAFLAVEVVAVEVAEDRRRTAAATARPSPVRAWDPLDRADVEALRADGVPCPERLGAGLRLLEARRGEAGDAVHLTYGDGLATVSVFHQPGDLEDDALADWRPAEVAGHRVLVRPGAPTTLAWQAEGWVTTVVADAPPAVVAAAVADLDHAETATPGLVQRLERGLGELPAVLRGG